MVQQISYDSKTTRMIEILYRKQTRKDDSNFNALKQ